MTPAATFGRRGVAAAPTKPPPPPRTAPRDGSPPPPPANVVESGERTVLQYVSWLLFSFKGRLGLRGYRTLRIASNVVLLLVVYGAKPSGSSASLPAFALLLLATVALYIWTTLAMQVKRWHDRDKSWFWLFIGFIPFVGPWWVLIETNWLRGSPGYNRFDEPSRSIAATFA